MKPLTVMAWDTATTFTCAAIVRFTAGGAFETLAGFELEGGPSHSQILPPQAAALLQGASLTPADLDLVAVGRGPGSFTGLRTGLALAKGLALGADIPLMGLSTLETLAAALIFGHGAPLAAPVIDARHREVFAALYRASGGGGLALECLLPPRPVAPASFAALIAGAAPGGGKSGCSIAVAGNGLDQLGGALDGSPNLSARPACSAPSAVMLARLAVHRLKQEGPAALAANPPLPLYIRQPDIRSSGIILK